MVEILTRNGNGKTALGETATKMELAIKLCHDTYKSKSVSFQATLVYYFAMVRPGTTVCCEYTS